MIVMKILVFTILMLVCIMHESYHSVIYTVSQQVFLKQKLQLTLWGSMTVLNSDATVSFVMN